MDTTDVAMLDRWIHQRDAEALHELVRRHSSAVYATCRRILRNDADAQDVAQECFIALLQRPPVDHRGRLSLAGWLHTVATRRALKRTVADRRRRIREDAHAARTGDSVSTDFDDVQSFVDEAIANLPENLREPIVAHFLEGRTHQAIGDALGLPRRTVTSRIAKGIDEVRNALRHKGVLVSASALASVLSIESAQAAPAGPTAALGKLVLAEGITATAGAAGVGGAAPLAGGLLAMKTISVLTAAAVLVVGLWYFSTRPAPAAMPDNAPPGRASSPETGPVDGASEAVTRATATGPSAVPPALPEDSGAGAVKARSGPASVYGRVTNDRGELVAQALVQLDQSDFSPGKSLPPLVTERRTGATDAAGRFAFERVPLAGCCCVAAIAQGAVATSSFSLDDVTPVVELQLQLKPAGAIAGRVRDENGSAIAGAFIVPVAREADGATVPVDPALTVEQTISQANGAFRLDRLTKGRWQLLVKAGGFAARQTGWLATGATDVDVLLDRGATVMGNVARKDNNSPIANIRVLVRSESPDDLYEVSTDAAGAFHVDSLRPGHYFAQVSGAEWAMAGAPVAIEVAPNHGPSNLKLLVVPGATISGRVVYARASEKAVSGATVRVVATDSELRLQPRLSQPTDTSGAYTIAGMAPGEYDVSCFTVPGCPRPYSGYATQRVVVKQGERVTDVDFRLSGGGILRGRVLDINRNPLGKAFVLCLAANFPAALAVSDSEGLFSFPAAPVASEVYLRAGANGLTTDLVGPLVVPEAGLDNVTVTMQAICSLSGRVEDTAHKPVAGIALSIARSDDPYNALRNMPSVRSKSDGSFVLEGLTAGPYELLFAPPGNLALSESGGVYALSPGQHLQGVVVAVDHGAYGKISGRVTDTAGAAIQGLEVAGTTLSHNTNAYANTDANGQYVLAGLTEEDYLVTVRDQAPQPRYSRSKELRVHVGESAADFVLRGTGAITGRVIDSRTGKPIPKFDIGCIRGEIPDPPPSNIKFSEVRDSEGRYRLNNVEVGPNTVVVRAQGYAVVVRRSADVAENTSVDAFDVLLTASP